MSVLSNRAYRSKADWGTGWSTKTLTSNVSRGSLTRKKNCRKSATTPLRKKKEFWFFDRQMAVVERDTESHRVLLQWIEHQRVVMEQEEQQQKQQQKQQQQQENSQVARRSTRQLRTRRRPSPSTLGEAGISKPVPKTRTAQSAAARNTKANLRAPKAPGGQRVKTSTHHRKSQQAPGHGRCKERAEGTLPEAKPRASRRGVGRYRGHR